jgi:hypothetical protein
MEVVAGLPAWFGNVGGGEALPNPAGNSATSPRMISIPLAQNTPALRQTHRRAGVSGGKEAWMVMEVVAGLPAWFGSVEAARRSQSGG